MTASKSDLPFNGWYLVLGILAAWVVLYRSTLPGVFHLRILVQVVRQILGKTKPLTDLDKELVIHERVWLGDLDFNIHANNARYNEVLDFARFDFFMRLAAAGGGILKDAGKLKIGNGGVSIFFLRELRPFQAYWVRTRVIGIDKKWCFFLHTFESGKKDSPKVHALASSKIVFKHKSGAEAGKTIPPAEVFAERGIKLTGELFAQSQGASTNVGETLHKLLALYEEGSGPSIAAALGGPAGLRTPGPLNGESTPLAAGGRSAGQYAHEATSSSSSSMNDGGLRVRKP